MRRSVLIFDDETSLLKALDRFFRDRGYEVHSVSKAPEGLAILKSRAIDVILVDLMLANVSGIDVVRRAREIKPDQVAIVMTAFGTIASAVEAIRSGAFHYVTKPFDLEDIGALVDRAIEHARLKEENRLLHRQLKKRFGFGAIIGQSAAFREVLRLSERIAETDSTVLITGESGTGKEVLARAIHHRSDRADRPFVAVNCAAIPEGLLESELFGHVRGAFTDAVATRPGRFEQADQGTIFLDEIGDMSPKLQVKVLRVIQERCFEPVGAAKSREVDIRIMAATHQDLRLAVREGRFREDLFYRLNVIPVHLPAMRDRKGDLPLLAEHFLKKYNQENGKKIPGFTKEAMTVLRAHRWPGNIRELENLVERVVVLKKEGWIEKEDLPFSATSLESRELFSDMIFPEEGLEMRKMVERLENALIKKALEQAEGNRNKAAALLRLNRTTLLEKMRKMNGKR